MAESLAIIANRELMGIATSGSRFPVRIEIAKPCPMKDPNDNWRCCVRVTPFLNRWFEVGGYDSLQALALAISLARRQLFDFVQSGGRLCYPGSDDEYKLDETFLKIP